MCGRFTITVNADTVRQDLGIAEMPEDYRERYNVAPMQPVVVVADGEGRKGEWMRWGLIPFWAKDPSIGSRLINARAETVAEKPAFKQAFVKRRCLILADGFYEWQKGTGAGGRSQPFLFKRKDDKPFAFAGLWDVWKDPEGEALRTCTIITTEANELVRSVHERMPVMLSGNAMWAWLGQDSPKDLTALLKPYPAEAMKGYPVSPRVNWTDLDIPDLIQPLAA